MSKMLATTALEPYQLFFKFNLMELAINISNCTFNYMYIKLRRSTIIILFYFYQGKKDSFGAHSSQILPEFLSAFIKKEPIQVKKSIVY